MSNVTTAFIMFTMRPLTRPQMLQNYYFIDLDSNLVLTMTRVPKYNV